MHCLTPIPALILAAALAAADARASDLSQQLDGIFGGIDPAGAGCNVGVLEAGEWQHRKGYGLANLELAVPLDGSQVHRMGSVSKQFTAMAVLLLADEGRIDLDADIHDYLPELPPYASRVTVNAMLGHVSGMGDYDLISGSYEGPAAEKSIDLRTLSGRPFSLGNEDYLRIEEFYDVVKRVPLAAPPEQAFRYSNLAYFLLSMLVEAVSGESLREYAERRIFAPLGMRDTFFSDDPVELVPNRAYGYKRNAAGEWINDMTNLFWVGDGGLHTTLDDLALWDRNFYRPTVGDDPTALIARMNTPNSDFDARGARYANGQFVSEIEGTALFAHSGGWLGTLTYYGRLPAREASLFMLCNDASLDVDTLREQALEAVLADTAASPGAPLAGTRWLLRELYGEAVAPAPAPEQREPHIVLGDDGRLGGNTGCNRITGSVAIEDDQLVPTTLATTRMACPPPLDSLEERFITVLELGARWHIDGDTLQLRHLHADRVVARFEATGNR